MQYRLMKLGTRAEALSIIVPAGKRSLRAGLLCRAAGAANASSSGCSTGCTAQGGRAVFANAAVRSGVRAANPGGGPRRKKAAGLRKGSCWTETADRNRLWETDNIGIGYDIVWSGSP